MIFKDTTSIVPIGNLTDNTYRKFLVSLTGERTSTALVFGGFKAQLAPFFFRAPGDRSTCLTLVLCSKYNIFSESVSCYLISAKMTVYWHVVEDDDIFKYQGL